MHSLRLFLRIYWPGHVGVSGNELAFQTPHWPYRAVPLRSWQSDNRTSTAVLPHLRATQKGNLARPHPRSPQAVRKPEGPAMHCHLHRGDWSSHLTNEKKKEEELADRLASTADITSGLQLGRAEVLRGLRNVLNMDRPDLFNTDRPKKKGVEKGTDVPPSEIGNDLFQGQPWG